jgi:hypothetical protein
MWLEFYEKVKNQLTYVKDSGKTQFSPEFVAPIWISWLKEMLFSL